MRKSTYVTQSPDHMILYAKRFAQSLSGGEIITLRGDLGAGKTTFSQGVLGALGAVGPFTSPTFTIIKQYDLSEAGGGFQQGISRVYHIDAYRITDVDMVELGWQEMIDDVRAVVLIEWPEKIVSLIPRQSLEICFEIVSAGQRRISLSASGIDFDKIKD